MRSAPIRDKTLEQVQQSPGLSSAELSKMSGIPLASTSSALTELTTLRLVNRIRASDHLLRYYPKGAALPAGHERWDNKIEKRAERSDKRAPAAAVPAAPAPDMLLTFPTADNGTTTLTIGEARRLYAQLGELFGAP